MEEFVTDFCHSFGWISSKHDARGSNLLKIEKTSDGGKAGTIETACSVCRIGYTSEDSVLPSQNTGEEEMRGLTRMFM